MAPTKTTKPIVPVIRTRSSISRVKPVPTTLATKNIRAKRKADASPPKETSVKRSAFGDITNAVLKPLDLKPKQQIPLKRATLRKIVAPSVKTVVKPKQTENLAPPPAPVQKVQKRVTLRSSTQNQTALKPKESNTKENKVKTRLSNEFEKNEESLYSTALDDINVSTRCTGRYQTRSKSSGEPEIKTNVSLVTQQMEKHLNLGTPEVPEWVNDFDKENWEDIFQVSQYAMGIFTYLKSREPQFSIQDYMGKQVCLTKWMRSLLVDWMVEIQESFELNHETLYLGVKLVDLYLTRVVVSKETLQLVGAASMFIASKYDERIPPLLDDFLYICDGAYSKRELTKMEINILKICDFDLGMPLSYRFLRRYARCARVTMPVLTLARYILEYSLMDYATVAISDSKLASAALYLALRMKKVSEWTATLQFYSGYKLEQVMEVVHLLNEGLHRKPKEQLMTVRNKYSHKIFFEVAKTPLLTKDELLI